MPNSHSPSRNLPQADRIRIKAPMSNDMQKNQEDISRILTIVSNYAVDNKVIIQFDGLIKLDSMYESEYYFLFTGQMVYDLVVTLKENGFDSKKCLYLEVELDDMRIESLPLLREKPTMDSEAIHAILRNHYDFRNRTNQYIRNMVLNKQ